MNLRKLYLPVILPAMLLALGAFVAPPARANGPTFDSSGNANLNGTYYFRQVVYVISTSSGGSPSFESAVNGSLVFNGDGTYSFTTGTVTDSSNGQFTISPLTGTYTLSASGQGFLSSPLNGVYNGVSDTVSFMFTNGVLIGSSTESSNRYNDILIATLQNPSSFSPSNANFAGTWSMAGYLPGPTPGDSEDVFFQLSPGPGGTIPSVSVTGYIGVNQLAVQTQTTGNVQYSFSSGAAVLNFPTPFSPPALFYSGQVYMNFSPDGNFMFGGQANGFDMLVGVRTPASGATQNFGGLYYQAGVDQDLSQYVLSSVANTDTYWGSFNAAGGVIREHQRVQSAFNPAAFNSTFADTYTTPVTGTYNDSGAYMQFAYGGNGLYRIGAGTYPYLGLSVAVQAPGLSGAGVYLSPTGVVNAASFDPFTAGVANGEYIALFGSNLAPSTAYSSGAPFPTVLNGVQVLINGLPSPLTYVSPGQIVALVPGANPFPVAQIQVMNKGVASNTVTELVYSTAPGVFTTASGVGYAASQHGNYSYVTPGNPALPGETITLFLTGLGAVFPSPADGAVSAGATATNATFTAAIGQGGQLTAAGVTYAGLSPGAVALGQVNITIPTTATPGDASISITGSVSPSAASAAPVLDSNTAQALVPVGGASASYRKPAAELTNAEQLSARPARITDIKPIVESGAYRLYTPPVFERRGSGR